MDKLFVIGSDKAIFNLEGKNVFNYLLEELGLGEKSEEIQQKYEKERKKGPLLLKDHVALFKNIKVRDVGKASKKLLDEKLRRDFSEFVDGLYDLGYTIAIISSNPSNPYEMLMEDHDVDYVFANELENNGMIFTGRYKKFTYPRNMLKILDKYPRFKRQINGKLVTEPNRFGLAIKVAELIEKEKIDISKSWVLVSSSNRLPLLDIINRSIAFGKAEKEFAERATVNIEEDSLKAVLRYIT